MTLQPEEMPVSLYAVTEPEPQEKQPPRERPVLAVVPSSGPRVEAPVAPSRGRLAACVWAALDEGLAHVEGGEVVIRSGDAIGRIYLYKGAIAWVNCSRLQVRVRDTLLANSGIAAEELNAALQESQQLRQHFAETLLAWGLIDRQQLWHCLRLHNAQHLSAITQLRGELQALFVPLVRTYSAGLLFSLEELLEPGVKSELPSAPASSVPLLDAKLAAVLPSAALGGVVIDMEARQVRGHCFHLRTLEPELGSLSQWLMELLARRMDSGSGPREVLLVARDTVHVLSRCESHPAVYLWVLFDSSTQVGAVLAHCHLALKALESELPAVQAMPAR